MSKHHQVLCDLPAALAADTAAATGWVLPTAVGRPDAAAALLEVAPEAAPVAVVAAPGAGPAEEVTVSNTSMHHPKVDGPCGLTCKQPLAGACRPGCCGLSSRCCCARSCFVWAERCYDLAEETQNATALLFTCVSRGACRPAAAWLPCGFPTGIAREILHVSLVSLHHARYC